MKPLRQLEDKRGLGVLFRIKLRPPREIDVFAVDVQRQGHLVGLVPHEVDASGRHCDDLSLAEYLLADFLQSRVPWAAPSQALCHNPTRPSIARFASYLRNRVVWSENCRYRAIAEFGSS